MEKAVQITLIICGTILFLGLVAFSIISPAFPQTNTVTGTGEASIKVTPDIVGVYFNVETSGTTSKEAKDANSEIVDGLITELLKQGFERKQIQTQNFNIYEDYDWTNGQRIPKGFKATHSIKVELSSENSEKIGEIIDAGVDAGARISYINFELSQELQNTHKAEAMKLAAQDAKTKANAIAEGLSEKLGNLVSTSSNDFDYQPWRLHEAVGSGISEDAELAKEASTNIQPSEREISARVTAVFKLK
ncbi:SIMPL domain-containing protein [archaeon]|nr:SIMPL domain-containing protein [archaeon]MBT4373434.1 SIMPL domain-containing protein [archaeon]MBT4531882.1 SIMPL domain-containing protein [archaeon]MBT7001549.1 SIMPL domain-containing protein [archaeon]MBT7282559.1 SIMPL domain-containing protein [archaeon]